MRALVDDVVAAEGGLDVVFANAGIASVPGYGVEDGQTLDTVEPADWDRVLGINLSGVLFTMKHAASVMRRQGSGRIVVTSSARRPQARAGGVLRLRGEQGGRPEHRPARGARARADGVLVNAICPGPFKGTRIGGGVTGTRRPSWRRMWSKTVPLGRMADCRAS